MFSDVRIVLVTRVKTEGMVVLCNDTRSQEFGLKEFLCFVSVWICRDEPEGD